MKLIILLFVLALLALLALLLHPFRPSRTLSRFGIGMRQFRLRGLARWLQSRAPRRVVFTACNIAEGTDEHGRKTFFGDIVMPQRFSIVKYGSGVNNCTLITGDTDQVLGVTDDEISDITIPIAVHLAGAVKGSQKVYTTYPVTHGSILVADGATAGAKPLPVRNAILGAVTLAANKITAVALVSGGTQYVQNQGVTFQDATGYGATGYLNVTAGVITSIIITNPGAAYTAPIPIITPYKYQRLGLALQDTAGSEVIEYSPIAGEISI